MNKKNKINEEHKYQTTMIVFGFCWIIVTQYMINALDNCHMILATVCLILNFMCMYFIYKYFIKAIGGEK